MINMMADGILEVLTNLEDGRFRRIPGRVITELATLIVGYSVQVGDAEYHACSQAILFLEELELVRVERLYSRNKGRANLLAWVERADT